MANITINNINIDLLPGPIGIAHSGGADSGILLYILMKNSSYPIHVFTCANRKKFYTNGRVSFNVIEKCMELTGNMNVIQHSYFVENQTFESLFGPIEYFYKLNMIKYIYTGITNLPPSDELPNNFDDPRLINNRNPTVIKDFYSGNDKQFYMPLTNSNKKDVYNLYKALDRLDDLFPLTRSCESLEIKSGHCGKCWWCEERQWAFGRLE